MGTKIREEMHNQKRERKIKMEGEGGSKKVEEDQE